MSDAIVYLCVAVMRCAAFVAGVAESHTDNTTRFPGRLSYSYGNGREWAQRLTKGRTYL